MRANEFVSENFAVGKHPGEFLGEYPSIETTLGEATHPDLVQYGKKREKQLHRDLDVSKNSEPPDYDLKPEKNWTDVKYCSK